MPGISIHVVDVSRGCVAQGMNVSLWTGDGLHCIAAGVIDAKGLLSDPALEQQFARGYYEARFVVGSYFEPATTRITFLDQVNYRFGIDDPKAHYHLPMKLTAWGLSCFRGGA
jgi:5-hydroxyisourate hydrolase